MKLVLFDCDGTLVDSQNVIVTAMTRAFAAAGLEPPPRAAILGIVGLSLVEAMQALARGGPGHPARPLPAEHLAELYRDAFRAMRAEQDFAEPLYPGIAALIDTLAAREDMLLGLATGKSQRGVAMVLAHHGLEGRFVTIQTADDAPSKPHPAMVEQAMAATGIPAQRTVLVGDTGYDMAMARAAGVRAIGVSWGYHLPPLLEQAGAHLIVHDADALRQGLDTIWEMPS